MEVPGVLVESLNQSVAVDIVRLLEKITLLLLGVLYGDQDTEDKGTVCPNSIYDTGHILLQKNLFVYHRGASIIL